MNAKENKINRKNKQTKKLADNDARLAKTGNYEFVVTLIYINV